MTPGITLSETPASRSLAAPVRRCGINQVNSAVVPILAFSRHTGSLKYSNGCRVVAINGGDETRVSRFCDRIFNQCGCNLSAVALSPVSRGDEKAKLRTICSISQDEPTVSNVHSRVCVYNCPGLMTRQALSDDKLLEQMRCGEAVERSTDMTADRLVSIECCEWLEIGRSVRP